MGVVGKAVLMDAAVEAPPRGVDDRTGGTGTAAPREPPARGPSHRMHPSLASAKKHSLRFPPPLPLPLRTCCTPIHPTALRLNPTLLTTPLRPHATGLLEPFCLHHDLVHYDMGVSGSALPSPTTHSPLPVASWPILPVRRVMGLGLGLLGGEL